MANTLRFKRGLVSGIPTAALGEPLFTTDTFDLYIGNGTGNTRFQKYIASGTTSQLLRGDGSLLTMPIVLTSPSNGQVLKYNGTSWVNDSDAGITGSGASGQVAYFTGATTQSGSNNLFWDNTNGRLGIGLSTPATKLELLVTGNDGLRIRNSANTGSDFAVLDFVQASVQKAVFYTNNDNFTFNVPSGQFIGQTAGSQRFRITNGGNFIINNASTDNGLRFQVTGDGYFSGSVGIGTTPTQKLNVSGTGNYLAGFINSVGTSAALIYFRNTSGDFYIGNDSSSGGAVSGTAYAMAIWGQGAYPMVFATNNLERMRLHAGGNLHVGGTTDNGLRFQVTGDGYFSGRVHIGTTSNQLNNSFQVARTMTGAVVNNGINSYGQIQSDVTTEARYFMTDASTQAASFTLASLFHYRTFQSAFGAGSSVTNQYGFFVDSTLVGATNNYGFYGNIASGTGRWNLYMNGTAANYLNGQLLIGTTTTSSFPLDVNGAIRSSGLITAATEFRLNNHSFSRIAILDTNGAIAGGYNFKLTSNVPQHDSTGAISGYYYHNSGYIGWFTGTSQAANTNATERMRLDASGNLGLGVTPSAWRSNERVLQIGSYTSVSDVFGYSSIGNNFFVNASNQFIYLNTAATSVYSQNAGSHIWQSAASGTAGTSFSFTTRMTLFQTGNLTIGSTTTDAGFRLDVNGTMRVSGASIFVGSGISGNTHVFNNNSGQTTLAVKQSAGSDLAIAVWNDGTTGNNSFIRFFTETSATTRGEIGYDRTNNRLSIIGTNGLTFTGAATFSSNLTVDTDTFFVDATNNRVGVGTITPSYKAHIVNNASSPTYLALQNTTAGSTSAAIMKVISDASSGSGEFLKKSSTGNTYKVMTSNDLVIYNDTAGDIDIFNDHANGKINLTSGGSSSTQLTLDTSGRLGFSNTSPTAYCDLAASTTAIASLRIRSGSAPTAPNDGDIWFDGTDLKIRVAGVTKTFTLV